MTTAAEHKAILVKPMVDALIDLYKTAKTTKLKPTAEMALSNALQELFLANDVLRTPLAKVCVARAVGVIQADLVLGTPDSVRRPAKKVAPTKKTTVKKVPAKPAPAAKGQTTLNPAAPWPFAVKKKKAA